MKPTFLTAQKGLALFRSKRVIDVLLWIILIGALLHFFIFLADFFSHRRQPDYSAYYYRSRLYAEGKNPYERMPLETKESGTVRGKFLYPPMTLPFFEFLSRTPFWTGYYLFLSANVIGAILLITFWLFEFNWAQIDKKIFLIVAILGFSRCLEKDLFAGNIVVFEQLGLWLAFYFYLRKKWIFTCLLIALVSLFKISPICLLAVCLTRRDYRAWISDAFIGACYILLLFNPVLNPPWLMAQFFSVASHQDERGSTNPCLYAWIHDKAASFLHFFGTQATPGFLNQLYFFILVILWISALLVLIRFRWRLGSVPSLVLVLFVYALSMPRFKNYSYALLIVPSLYIIWNCLRSPSARLFALVMVCFNFYHYQQLSVIVALYLLFIFSLLKKREDIAFLDKS